MWTVSGDYALDTKVESAFYTKSRYVCLYDAAKQGAFARYYDVSMLEYVPDQKSVLWCG
ncbi:MAG: hypothetical protein ACLTSZ_15610 [Lachnospiraceae bacterium]